MTKHIYNLKIVKQPLSLLKYEKHILTTIEKTVILPPKIDLRSKCPPIFDQGQLGSCTANALCSEYQFCDYSQDSNSFTPSRLFVYYNERKEEHSVKTDRGATISDGILSLKNFGVCPETLWPYNIKKFTEKPSKEAYKEAEKHKAIIVSNIPQTESAMKKCLAASYPFVVGISIYSSFENEDVDKTGKIPLPNTKTEKLLGGHAIMIVGYDDEKKTWIMRNSWGTKWGDNATAIYHTTTYSMMIYPPNYGPLQKLTKKK